MDVSKGCAGAATVAVGAGNGSALLILKLVQFGHRIVPVPQGGAGELYFNTRLWVGIRDEQLRGEGNM